MRRMRCQEARMLVTQQKILRRFWYPVVPADRLTDGAPALHPARHQHRAVPRCRRPRVGADRSLLPSHGEAQQRLGRGRQHRLPLSRLDLRRRRPLRAHPAAAGRRSGKEHRGRTFRCTERYGVCLGRARGAVARHPRLPEYDDPAYRRVFEFYEPGRRPVLRIMENSFDNAHFAFVHKGASASSTSPSRCSRGSSPIPRAS